MLHFGENRKPWWDPQIPSQNWSIPILQMELKHPKTKRDISKMSLMPHEQMTQRAIF